METILQYIYMRQIDINYESAFEIIRTADYLCINGLVELCQGFLIECMRPNNCVTLLQFAEYVLVNNYYFNITESSIMKLEQILDIL